jgi:hypothetical protein
VGLGVEEKMKYGQWHLESFYLTDGVTVMQASCPKTNSFSPGDTFVVVQNPTDSPTANLSISEQ